MKYSILFIWKGWCRMISLAVNNFCLELSPVLKMIGDALNIFKVTLPLVLIILCIFDIGKAVISSKSSDVKKNIVNCAKKLAVCVLVFFIPTICMIVFGFVDAFDEITKKSGLDFDVCYDCMFNSSGENCKSAVEIAELTY